MRKLRRSVAHAKMRKEGLVRVNKKVTLINGKKVKGDSFFSQHWHEYVPVRSVEK